nr:MAG TPA: Protein gp18.1, prophage tail protein gp18.7A [Caudoviricetes sp.]
MDKLKIYSSSGVYIRDIDSVISCSFRDSLAGECSLEFSLLSSDCVGISEDGLILLGSLYFRISGVKRSLSGGLCICSYTCEHESMALSDDKVETFSYSGSASGALGEILSGTALTAGTAPVTSVEIDETNTNRRRLLSILTEKLGYEAEFALHKVNLVSHRGRTLSYDISRYADLTEMRDGDNVSYELTLSVGDYGIGDEVRVLCPALGISARRRIIELSYEPYNADFMRVTAGDYVPEITDSIGDVRGKVDDLRKDTEEALADTAKKSDLTASIDTYINSEVGKASIILSLSGSYATVDDLTGYTKKTELSAEIGAYIDTHEGTAKIINALSGTYVTSDELGDYVEKTELQTEIGSYIDTQAGTAKIISACSGTYQKKSDMAGYVTTTSLSSSIEQYIDSKAGTAKLISAVSGTYQTKAGMTDYVKTTELNTTVAQYIDSKAGTAKIVSACSGTYQTISGMSDYAKVSAVTSIEQSVSDVEASITLSSSYSQNTIGTNVYALLQLVSNANSSSIKLKADKIDFTGFTTFLRASDLGSSGTTSIDGGRIKTGTISADRIDVSNLKVYELYAKSGTSTLKILSATGSTITFGGQGAFTSIKIYCGTATSSGIELGVNSSSCVTVDTSGKAFYAFGSYALGRTANPWKTLYIGDSASLLWTMDASGLIPSSTTLDRFNIGSDTKRVNKIYGKELSIQTKVQLGTATTSTLGFFGTTPVARQTVSSTATVATLITALKKYGLIA